MFCVTNITAIFYSGQSHKYVGDFDGFIIYMHFKLFLHGHLGVESGMPPNDANHSTIYSTFIASPLSSLAYSLGRRLEFANAVLSMARLSLNQGW